MCNNRWERVVNEGVMSDYKIPLPWTDVRGVSVSPDLIRVVISAGFRLSEYRNKDGFGSAKFVPRPHVTSTHALTQPLVQCRAIFFDQNEIVHMLLDHITYHTAIMN